MPAEVLAPVSVYVTCRHCRRQYRALRTVALCEACYRQPRLRPRYAGRMGRRNDELAHKAPKALPRPTSYAPGSDEKLAVLVERAARNESLFHPQDASGL